MASKRSCFNPTLMWKNVLRFWPCWAGTLLIALLILPFGMSLSLPHNATASRASSYTTEMVGIVAAAAFALGILVPILLNKYLYTARSANFFHALPIRREGLLITNTVSGLFILWTPMVLTAIVTLLVELSFDAVDALSLFQLLLLYLGSSLLFFGIGTLCTYLTGMSVAAIGLYVAVNFAVIAIYYLFAALTSSLIPSFTFSEDPGKILLLLTPIVNIYTDCTAYATAGAHSLMRLNGLPLIGAYAIAGVVLLVITVLLVRRRQTEHAGDLLSFNCLRPVFKVLFSLVLGIAGGLAMAAIYDLPSFTSVLIWTLVWSLIFWMIAEMLVRKSVRIFQRGVFARWAALAACLALVLVGLNLDLFHIARRVPAAEDVKSVSVACMGEAVLTEPEQIEKSIALQQTFIANEKQDRSVDSGWSNVVFTYRLNNGSSFARQYRVPYAVDDHSLTPSQTALSDFLSDPDITLARLFDGPLSGPAVLWTITLEDWTSDMYDELTGDDAWALYQAIEADIRAGNYPSDIGVVNSDEGKLYTLNFSVAFRHAASSQYNPGYAAVYFTDRMVNTIACLDELGYPSFKFRYADEGK